MRKQPQGVGVGGYVPAPAQSAEAEPFLITNKKNF